MLLSRNLGKTVKGFVENEIIEEEINFRAVERLFSIRKRSLQALRANSGKTKTHQIIRSLIGYDGLIKKSAEAGSNEPPKFRKERLFLEGIESQISLNEDLIKDRL